MNRPEVFRDCIHPGHEWVVEVDDHDVLYETCRRDDGTFHGDAVIFGTVTPSRARSVRRAARAYERERARRRGRIATIGGRLRTSSGLAR